SWDGQSRLPLVLLEPLVKLKWMPVLWTEPPPARPPGAGTSRLAPLARMSVRPLLDERFPTRGQWVGLGLGWVSKVWLTHFLSQADRRLHHVEPWAEQPLHWRVPWPSARRSSVSGCLCRCLWRQPTRFWSRQRPRDFQSTTRSSTRERTGRARH